jgi:hypothetical protein
MRPSMTHLGCADVDVVARAAAQVDRVQARAVLAHVVQEAGAACKK